MHNYMNWVARCAGIVMSLTLPFALAEPASARSESPEPAPACVAMYESWRYTQAANDCADTVALKVVYQDGATGPCHTLPPGAISTVGEGYLGLHGHADHLAVCALD